MFHGTQHKHSREAEKAKVLVIFMRFYLASKELGLQVREISSLSLENQVFITPASSLISYMILGNSLSLPSFSSTVNYEVGIEHF